MNNNKYLIKVSVVSFILIGVAFVMFLCAKPKMKNGVIPGMDAANFATDSSFIDNRQMGLVNLDKFLELASRLGTNVFDRDSVQINNDSVTFLLNTKKSNILFADYTNLGQTDKLQKTYKDFPITILDKGTGFRAKCEMIDSASYIRIPYLVLASLAEYVSGNSSTNTNTTATTAVDNTLSPSDFELLQSLRQGNKKIQTEGLVLRNFSDIQAVNNTNHESDPVKQLEIAWKFVKGHWLYLYDPNTESGKDTWRSASETISNYYSNGKCYTGDCDDFAILMASFARQVGLESRVKAVVKGNGGHAYAEFRRKGDSTWHNLDWFEDFDSPQRFVGDKEFIYDVL